MASPYNSTRSGHDESPSQIETVGTEAVTRCLKMPQDRDGKLIKSSDNELGYSSIDEQRRLEIRI